MQHIQEENNYEEDEDLVMSDPGENADQQLEVVIDQ